MKANDIQLILNDPLLRSNIAYQSHYWCFHTYFAHYVKYETAPFQQELFAITQDTNNKLAVIVSFRGSAKSTIMALSYPIWAILGKQQKKFILLVSQTQQQARLMLLNIRREFEGNRLLKNDLGPFQEESNEWGTSSLVLPKYDARITAISRGQSMRGVRRGEIRPDLIIIDDVEDLSSVKTRESRDDTYEWLTGDIIPCGDRDTKVIMIGNLLHQDSLLMRLKDGIEDKRLEGVYREYPLVDDKGVISWLGKFPNMRAVMEEKKRIGNNIAWKREYELKILPDGNQLVKPDWIQYYNEIPDSSKGFRYIATGVDLAISERSSADYTAMVSAYIYGFGEHLRIYIVPNPVNERMSFEKTVRRAEKLSSALGNGNYTKMFIEETGYQGSLIERLKQKGVPSSGIRPVGDKRERLSVVTQYIETGKVLFPKKGAELLIDQLLYFEGAKHDDLVDAFVYLILKITEQSQKERKVFGPPLIVGTRSRWF